MIQILNLLQRNVFYYFMGFGIAFSYCIWTGIRVRNQDQHPNFGRFHIMIAPDTHYYPTLSEMQSIIRKRCQPDQILIIIGGNSILNGVGQPIDQIWSRRLSEELGSRYCVINFAFRGATMTDAAAVVAESLRTEFPNQIYVTNTGAMGWASPFGSTTYRWLFWEAFYNGALIDDPIRNLAIKTLQEPGLLPLYEQAVYQKSAHLTAAPDLWNSFNLNTCMTIATPLLRTWSETLKPRAKFQDIENNFNDIPFKDRYRAENNTIEMEITKGFSILGYKQPNEGNWVQNKSHWEAYQKGLSEMMPKELRARTLILLSRNSPFYLSQLSPSELEREDLSYADSLTVLNDLGFSAIEYGRDFNLEDYGDRTHLTIQGGTKLATLVAKKIKTIAHKINSP